MANEKGVSKNATKTDRPNSPVKGHEKTSGLDVNPDSGCTWDGWNYPEGTIKTIYGNKHECRGGWWVRV